MEPNDITLESIDKLFEYEKHARTIDELNLEELKKFSKLYCKLYLKQQEVISSFSFIDHKQEVESNTYMAAVYVNNLIINAGSDFSQSFTLEGNDSNSTFDLTNYTVSSQMRKWAGSSSYTEFATEIVQPPAEGQILLVLTAAQTKQIKSGRYIYDVVITDNYGIKNRVIEGNVLVREGATQ